MRLDRRVEKLGHNTPTGRGPAGGHRTTHRLQAKHNRACLVDAKTGYKESTIQGRIRMLKTLVKRGANLLDPETVKEVVAKQSWSEGRKELVVETYSCFLKMKGGKWNPPKYTRIPKLPWIPTEKEIDQLIAATSDRMGTFLLGRFFHAKNTWSEVA